MWNPGNSPPVPWRTRGIPRWDPNPVGRRPSRQARGPESLDRARDLELAETTGRRAPFAAGQTSCAESTLWQARRRRSRRPASRAGFFKLGHDRFRGTLPGGVDGRHDRRRFCADVSACVQFIQKLGRIALDRAGVLQVSCGGQRWLFSIPRRPITPLPTSQSVPLPLAITHPIGPFPRRQSITCQLPDYPCGKTDPSCGRHVIVPAA